MLTRTVFRPTRPSNAYICLSCLTRNLAVSTRRPFQTSRSTSLNASTTVSFAQSEAATEQAGHDATDSQPANGKDERGQAKKETGRKSTKNQRRRRRQNGGRKLSALVRQVWSKRSENARLAEERVRAAEKVAQSVRRRVEKEIEEIPKEKARGESVPGLRKPKSRNAAVGLPAQSSMSLKEALLQARNASSESKPQDSLENVFGGPGRSKKPIALNIKELSPEGLDFKPIDVAMPPVPKLSYGLDRVLFNPGVYRLQDPRSRVYNFDTYLEKIMPVTEFDFSTLGRFTTSSEDKDLIGMAKKLETKFLGSTSSLSGLLSHFHYLLSQWRPFNLQMLSREFPVISEKPTSTQCAPNAAFLRWRDGTYAIDNDKEYDTPNIMSWLGNSLEKLLTSPKHEFERFRKSNPGKPPSEEEEGAKSYHYSQLGNFLVRSQLDAHDHRLPGTGVFDVKTRAAVSIRMDSYEEGLGYQLRYDLGEWESFEREHFDMIRATMLKYSLQVRMGRMDGIFVAYHNIERIFGFQYISLPDMDLILHGQTDTCLGDQEFKMSMQLLGEALERATRKFPEQSLRIHVETRGRGAGGVPFMYIFAEPVTEDEIEAIQERGKEKALEFERSTIGLRRDHPRNQEEWQEIQSRVQEEIAEDEANGVDSEEISERASNNVTAEDEELAEDEDLHETEDGEEAEGAAGAETELEHSFAESKTNAELNSAAPLEDAHPDASETSGKEILGMVLTIRNRVNGVMVWRPTDLNSEDRWTIEYTLEDMKPTQAQYMYDLLRRRRAKYLRRDETETNKGLEWFRENIRQHTRKGREWRKRQDVIDEKIGKHVYTPLGPGSEESALHMPVVNPKGEEIGSAEVAAEPTTEKASSH